MNHSLIARFAAALILALTADNLQQGFTSARDVGGGDESVALRNAIDAGKIPGPRLMVSLQLE